nr:tax1-binding protein 1 homolog [Parasteatoda tepidariorum]
MMDDASSSKSDGEEEWMDLSKSDYAKVIFSNLYWNSLSGDVGCLFSLTQTVSKNPSDYIGIYKVGYDNLSQCLAMKKLSEFAYDTKPIHCGFKAEELPELNGFYQFLYVTHEKEVCGASMPFEVKQKKEDDEVVTERIENDFLIVRYGLEQKNQKLNTLLKTYEAENVVLVAKIRELRGEKGALTQKLEETEPLLNSATQELEQLKDEHLALAKELEFTRDKEAKILSILDATEKDFDREVKKAEVLLQLKRDVESMYENAVAENKAISLEFEEKVKEKEVLIAESNKIIEELSEEVKFKQIFIEKIIQESFDLTKARDVTLEEYKKRVDQLTLQVEKLTLERASKEKLLKDQWSRDKEEKYNLMEIDLQNALSQKHALEKEATQLRKYLKNPEEYMRQPTLMFNHMMPAGEKVTDEYLMEQLNDAKFMIKALEDSKQLAMKEMHELSEKLKKTKEELSQMRCENMALKIFLEEKSSSVV